MCWGVCWQTCLSTIALAGILSCILPEKACVVRIRESRSTVSTVVLLNDVGVWGCGDEDTKWGVGTNARCVPTPTWCECAQRDEPDRLLRQTPS